MRRLFLFLLLFGVATIVSAQNNSTRTTNLIVRVGVPNDFKDDGYKVSIPHISARYERQYNQNVYWGADVGFVSTKSINYRFQGDKYFYRRNFITISVNAYYFLDMVPLEAFDFYAGLGTGYKFGWSAFVGEGKLSGFDENPYSASDGVIYSVFLQARYRFKEHLSAYAEVGLGYLPLSLGFVYKFNF